MDEIKKTLNIIRSKIEAHNEFKTEYDKKIAFDFNLFKFFDADENKISEILAYFLNKDENHGQGSIFLLEFLNQFYKNGVDINEAEITCEKVITNDRRIDIYIKLKNEIIAIENKIWASDQQNQLRDYSVYLNEKSNGNYLLLYLNPFGNSPSSDSIDAKLKEELVETNNFKVISYTTDILPLINKWIMLSEAPNVTFFIEQFKKHLETKFIGNNTLSMTKNIKEIVFSYQTEVETIIKAYNEIENSVVIKLDKISKEIELNKNLFVETNIELKKEGPRNWQGYRIFKYGLSYKSNTIWVQLFKSGIDLKFNSFFQSGTDIKFENIVEELKIERDLILDRELKDNEIVNFYIEQIKLANKAFGIFENLKEKAVHKTE